MNATQNRASKANAKLALANIAPKLGFEFQPEVKPDFTKVGTVYIESVGDGLLRAVRVTENGTAPVFPNLPPLKAAPLIDAYAIAGDVADMLKS